MTLQQFSTVDKGIETKSHYRSAEAIPLSFSFAFQNKAPLKGDASFTHFRPAAFSLAELVKHVLGGHAFMPAQHKPFQRSNASFQCAKLLALDFDNDDSGTLPVSVQALQEHAFVGRFAAFIYATPSSTQARPKSRAVFVLDSLLLSVEGYERRAAALIAVCKDLQPDKACKDAARLYFGSSEAEHYIDAQAVLKVGLLDELAALDEVLSDSPENTETQKHHNAAAPLLPVSMHLHTDSAAFRNAEARRRAYVETAFDQNIGDIRAQAKGNRNNVFWRLTCNLLNVSAAAPDLLTSPHVIDAAAAAAHAAGLDAKEIEASIESALKTPRRALGGQWLNIQAALHAARNEQPPLRIVWPAPVRQDDESRQDEQMHQDDEQLHHFAALADSVRYLVADFSKPAAAVLNAIYTAQAQGCLSDSFDLQGVVTALAALGVEASEKSLYKPLNWLRKAGLLGTSESSSNEFFSEMSHREEPIGTCDILEKNSKGGRRRLLMSLLPMPEFMARLREFVSQNTLDSLYPGKPAREIDPHQITEYHLSMLVRVLEALSRRRITALKALHVQDALSDHEQAYAAAALDLIHSLPSMATAQALIDFGLSNDIAAAAAERLSAMRVFTSESLMRAMELKWALMGRIYKARIESLDNPLSTPLVLELEGQAFINHLRHESAKAFDGQAVSGRAMAAVFGMHERRSAYRAAAALGIERQERKQVVSIPEPDKMSIRMAEQAAKGKCVRVVAYAEDGSLLGAAAAYEAFKLPTNAARYEATIQQASLMLVGQMPERIERLPKIAAARSQDVAPDEMPARAAQPERVPRKRLYTPAFILSRILAPRIAQHAGLWVHPDTGELFDDAKALIMALIDQDAAQAS